MYRLSDIMAVWSQHVLVHRDGSSCLRIIGIVYYIFCPIVFVLTLCRGFMIHE